MQIYQDMLQLLFYEIMSQNVCVTYFTCQVKCDVAVLYLIAKNVSTDTDAFTIA